MIYKYDLVFIVGENIDDPEKVFSSVLSFVQDKATILDVEKIGLKKLVYEIKGNKSGYYYIIDFETDNSRIPEIENHIRYNLSNMGIVKFIIVRKGD